MAPKRNKSWRKSQAQSQDSTVQKNVDKLERQLASAKARLLMLVNAQDQNRTDFYERKENDTRIFTAQKSNYMEKLADVDSELNENLKEKEDLQVLIKQLHAKIDSVNFCLNTDKDELASVEHQGNELKSRQEEACAALLQVENDLVSQMDKHNEIETQLALLRAENPDFKELEAKVLFSEFEANLEYGFVDNNYKCQEIESQLELLQIDEKPKLREF